MTETMLQTASPELVKQVRDANDICHAAYNFFGKRDTILSELEDIYASRRRRMTFGFIMAGFVTFPGSFFLLAMVLANESQSSTALPTLIVIGFLVFYFSYVCGISLNRLEKKIRARADAEQVKGEAVLNDNAVYLAVIPEKYRFPLATEYILEMLRTGRAATLNEALDRADEQLHRWKMENNSNAALAVQIAQFETLKQIERNTFWDLI